MPAFFARFALRLGALAAGLASLALLSACESGAPSGQATGAYNGTPVAVALLVPSGSGEASDDLIATGLENAARMADHPWPLLRGRGKQGWRCRGRARRGCDELFQ